MPKYYNNTYTRLLILLDKYILILHVKSILTIKLLGCMWEIGFQLLHKAIKDPNLWQIRPKTDLVCKTIVFLDC